MSLSMSRARKLAKRLLNENSHGRTWRKIAEEDYQNKVNYATLNRFAKSEGEWTPKDKEILAALGLYKPRAPYPRPAWLYKWYHMPKEERHNVIRKHLDAKETKGILEWLNE